MSASATTNGMKVRRAVLGDAHVDRTLTRRNDFNSEFQELITRYAWGEIWTRPGPAAAYAQPAHDRDDGRAESRR